MQIGPGGGSSNPIPGNPQALFDIARQLRVLSTGLDEAVQAIQAIDAGHWTGKAADAFKQVSKIPAKDLEPAAEAFAGAANSINGFADALVLAQQVGANAEALTQAGQAATAGWQAAPPNQPGRPPTDPGAADSQQGASLLSGAQGDLHAAAQACIKALKAAEDGAPKKPSLLDKAWGDAESFAKGAWEGTKAMVTSLSELAQLIPRLDGWEGPAKEQQTRQQINQLGQEICHHPVQFAENFGSNMINLQTLKKNPAEWAGELVPNILAVVVSEGAGGAAKAASADANAADSVSKAFAGTAKILQETDEFANEKSLGATANMVVGGPDINASSAEETAAFERYAADRSAAAQGFRNQADQWNAIKSNIQDLNKLETTSGTALNFVNSTRPNNSSPGGSTAQPPWRKVPPVNSFGQFTTTIVGHQHVTIFMPPKP